MNLPLILASASPRRHQLLSLLGIPFAVRAADVDERSITTADPAQNVLETALLKAKTVAAAHPQPALILASDTTVALGQEMLNKPEDVADVWRMLRALRGRAHTIYTSIVLWPTVNQPPFTEVVAIPVTMRTYSDEEIAAYIATGDPMDKAGGYAIQHPVFNPALPLTHCYAGVMGLPVCHVTRALRQFGWQITVDVAAACQQTHQYDCPIYQSILP